jgi:pSer/pThr/pTyr-binding forkhead associated (FHA) protein
LNGLSITIGRHLENDIVVNTKIASRRHAIIRWQQGVFVIHDLGSKAGTRKNGVQIRESVLRPGDVIVIGDSSYIYGEGLTPIERESEVSPNSSGTTQALDRPSL